MKNTAKFKPYSRLVSSSKRLGLVVVIVELREIDESDINQFKVHRSLYSQTPPHPKNVINIDDEDLRSGSPKIGDMVARNPEDHLDQWLITKEFYEEFCKPI